MPCAAAPSYDPGNIFLKIINGTVPCYKIFETEHALAFLDAFPMTPGHALLVPKAPGYATLDALPEDVAAAVLSQLPRLVKAVKAATGAEGALSSSTRKRGGFSLTHVPTLEA